jgi:hypothetical protein
MMRPWMRLFANLRNPNKIWFLKFFMYYEWIWKEGMKGRGPTHSVGLDIKRAGLRRASWCTQHNGQGWGVRTLCDIKD